MSPLPFAQRRALVTGAASGIGFAIARALAEGGARVVLADCDGGPLRDATLRLDGAQAVEVDLASAEGVEALWAAAAPVDILVNCAGLQRVAPIEELDEATWERVLAVLLTAPYRLMRRALPGMYATGWGRIVNVSSVHGLVASPYKAAYVAAKHGLQGLTKVAALEAAAQGGDVTVHALCPSYVRTPLVERQIDEQARVHGLPREQVLREVLLQRNAIKRLLEPEDVARAAVWLCGEGSWAMTGGTLALDAGWLAH